MHLTVVETAPSSAAAIMARDAALLHSLEGTSEIFFHQYDWQGNALTYGHFIEPTQFLRPEGMSRWEIDAARRPTGGGILFHTHDLAFSILLPTSHPKISCNTLSNYALVNEAVLRAIQQFSLDRSTPTLLQSSPDPSTPHERMFCMANPTKYDVMLEGRKVGGAAQRRTRHGLLHQGSICLGLVPEECLREVLAVEVSVLEQMRLHSCPLLGAQPSVAEIREARVYLKHLLLSSISDIV